MKKTLLIFLALIIFGCHKAKQNKVTIHIEATGNEIAKLIKGNVYYGGNVIPVSGTFENHYSMDVLVDDQHTIPTHDLYVYYKNRNVDSGKEQVVFTVSIK